MMILLILLKIILNILIRFLVDSYKQVIMNYQLNLEITLVMHAFH